MEIRYFVNAEKRTVVAAIVNAENDFRRKVRRKVDSRFADEFFFRGERSYMPDKIVGKAKCAPEDVFDEMTGIQLARQRALEKYDRIFNRELDFLLTKIDEMAEVINELRKD